jgi:hypothetical protein
MFSIDLLKGTGVPLKSSPGKFALSTLPFIVPAVIIMIVIVHYGYNGTVLAMAKNRIEKIKTMTADYSDDIEFYQGMTSKLNNTNRRLSDVASVIDKNIQWTPMVRTMVETMPDSIILQKLRLNSDTIRKKMPDKNDKDKMVFVECIKRKMRITVYGASQYDSDNAVQGYIYRLRNSEVFMSEVTDVRIVARDVAKLDGRDVPCYEIDCLFKIQE